MHLASRVLLAVTFALFTVAAQAYPDRPVTIIVPFAPAGTTDLVARLMAPKMSEALGQQVVVENKPGAGGTIGSEAVALAAPDGYTLVMHTSSSAAITPWLYKTLPYDVRSFKPVALCVKVANVLVVHPSVAATNVQELIAYAKAHPGELNYGSSGNGTVLHLSGELFKTLAGIDVVHIPYTGAGPAMNDLLAGHIDYMFDNLPTSLPHIEAGTLRALAVTTTARSLSLPNVPTMIEGGISGYETYSWSALFAPAETPDDIIAKVADAALFALKDPQTAQQLTALSAEITPMGPQELAKFWAEQLEFWKPIVEKSGAVIE